MRRGKKLCNSHLCRRVYVISCEQKLHPSHKSKIRCGKTPCHLFLLDTNFVGKCCKGDAFLDSSQTNRAKNHHFYYFRGLHYYYFLHHWWLDPQSFFTGIAITVVQELAIVGTYDHCVSHYRHFSFTFRLTFSYSMYNLGSAIYIFFSWFSS